MRRLVVLLASVAAAAVGVVAFVAAPDTLAAATSGAGTFDSRTMLLALLTLGLLVFVAMGFDIRDWL